MVPAAPPNGPPTRRGTRRGAQRPASYTRGGPSRPTASRGRLPRSRNTEPLAAGRRRLPAVLSLRLAPRLPLHVLRGIQSAARQRTDVVDDVAAAPALAPLVDPSRAEMRAPKRGLRPLTAVLSLSRTRHVGKRQHSGQQERRHRLPVPRHPPRDCRRRPYVDAVPTLAAPLRPSVRGLRYSQFHEHRTRPGSRRPAARTRGRHQRRRATRGRRQDTHEYPARPHFARSRRGSILPAGTQPSLTRTWAR